MILTICRSWLSQLAVQFGVDGIGQDFAHRTLNFGRERSSDYTIFTFHQGFKPLLGNLGWIIFLACAHLGVVHSRTVEKVGIGWSRHQRGDGDTCVLQLVAQPCFSSP